MRFLNLFIVFFSSVLWAAPKVVSSISPLGALTTSLMQGISKPITLQVATVDAHHYQLKPSDLTLLQEADLIIWVGPNMEHSFIRAIAQLPPEKVLTLVKVVDLKKMPLPSGSHDQDGSIDPHLWLDPDNAKIIAKHITLKLIALDPEHQNMYEANLQSLEKQLNLAEVKIHKRLLPIANQAFYSYHDSLRYFDAHFNILKNTGITDNTDAPLSLYKIHRIREAMQADHAKCIFIEPNVSPTQLNALTENSNIKVIPIASMPGHPEDGIQSYIEMLNTIAKAFLECSEVGLN